MILRELFLGSRRFESIREQTGISPQLLSNRMKILEGEGVVRKIRYNQKPVRYEFALTAKGLDLWPVLIALKAFGDRHLTDDHEGYFLDLIHKGCGHVGNPHLACPACGEPTRPQDVSVRMSPAMIEDRAARSMANSQSLARSRRGRAAA